MNVANHKAVWRPAATDGAVKKRHDKRVYLQKWLCLGQQGRWQVQLGRTFWWLWFWPSSAKTYCPIHRLGVCVQKNTSMRDVPGEATVQQTCVTLQANKTVVTAMPSLQPVCISLTMYYLLLLLPDEWHPRRNRECCKGTSI